MARLPGNMTILFLLFFFKNPILFSIVVVSIYLPKRNLHLQEGSLFFISSPAFIVCRLFDDGILTGVE